MAKLLLASSLFALSIGFPLAGCKKRTFNADSGVKYGVFSYGAGTSYLWSIDRNSEARFCVGVAGGTPEEQEKMAAALEYLMSDLAAQWHQLLADDSDWNSGSKDKTEGRKIRITTRTDPSCLARIKTVGNASSLPEKDLPEEVLIAAYLDRSLYPDGNTEKRSHAFPRDRTIVLFVEDSKGDQKTLATVLAHEYGHILGLSDLYTDHVHGPTTGPIPGQPSTLMSDLNKPLTDDEQAGLKTVVKAMRTGKFECQKGFSKVTYEPEDGVARGNESSLFCVRSDWTPGTSPAAQSMGYVAAYVPSKARTNKVGPALATKPTEVKVPQILKCKGTKEPAVKFEVKVDSATAFSQIKEGKAATLEMNFRKKDYSSHSEKTTFSETLGGLGFKSDTSNYYGFLNLVVDAPTDWPHSGWIRYRNAKDELELFNVDCTL